MLSDLEIAQAATARPILDIATELGLHPHEIVPYGYTKAKVSLAGVRRLEEQGRRGRYVVVSAITPTPRGEGKTTTTIGLAQGLNRIGHSAAVTIRQPSLGPVFGIKGGAAGGGYAQVIPMEDFNLHLTGDVHAVGAAHNLAAAFLDNHIHQGNGLGIDARRVMWPHVVDISDRALRHAVIGLGGSAHGMPRETSWQITVASEVMAILALAADLADLRARLGRVILAQTHEGKPVTADDLGVAGSMAVLLRDALQPNLLQTLEGGAAFVHAGPFANIAHGNNSILADRLALATHDIVVTEAGFGSDMGAEKFVNIKCRVSGLSPDAAVLVATARAVRAHGGTDNLVAHVEILKGFGLPCVVAINRFPDDSADDLAMMRSAALAAGAADAVLCTHFTDGGAGAEDLAAAVWAATSATGHELAPTYDLGASLREKIEAIVTGVYGGAGVTYSPAALAGLRLAADLGLESLPVCMAKTQYSLSHDPKLKGRPKGFIVPISGIDVRAGAGFVTALTGDIMTMPGLPASPGGLNIDLRPDGTVVGLF